MSIYDSLAITGLVIIIILIASFLSGLITTEVTPTIYEIKNITISDKWHETPDNSYHIRYNSDEYVISEDLYKTFEPNKAYTISIEHKITYFFWWPSKSPDINSTKIRILIYK